MPSLSAFWRKEPTVLLVNFAILSTGVLALEWARSSLTSAFEYARRAIFFLDFLALAEPDHDPRGLSSPAFRLLGLRSLRCDALGTIVALMAMRRNVAASQCPFWVQLGPRGASELGPFVPQQQTSSDYCGKSVSCP